MSDTILELMKKNIMDDYDGWVVAAISDLEDVVGLRDISVNNFRHKIDKLIEYVTENQSRDVRRNKYGPPRPKNGA